MGKGFASTFQESDGTWSWSRVLGIVPLFSSCFSLIYLVMKNHASPDVMTLGGLATFAVCTYGVNKVSGVFSKAQ